MRNPILVLLLGVSWAGLASEARAFTITLNAGGTSIGQAEIQNNPGPFTFEQVFPSSLPFSHTSSLSDGSVSNETIYTLGNSALDVSFDHTRPSNEGSFARSTAILYFESDQDITYQATGSYTASDPEGRRTWFEAALFDLTANTSVFNSNQQSVATPGESFALGGTGGDSVNVSTGSLSGTLLAGHDYRFSYFVVIQAFPSPTLLGASAVGNLNLAFSPIPEPGTALLLGIGLAGLVARRRRLPAGAHAPPRRAGGQ